MIKERYENPIVGDQVNLRMFTYSSNARADVSEIQAVKIYFLDESQISQSNPDGRVEILSIAANQVQHPSEGEYLVSFQTDQTNYRIGSYIDRWELKFEAPDLRPGVIENTFNLYRDLWYTSPKPLVYDLGFVYNPFKIVQGESRYLRVDIQVFAPNENLIKEYYYYLRSLQSIELRISLDEGPAYDPVVPENNVLFNWTQVSFRENSIGYFLLDTAVDPRPQYAGKPMPTGIYLIQFRATVGETRHLSPNFRLQIYS